MAHYRIGMVQRVVEETTVEVEANNREEAEQKALTLARDGHAAWDFLEAPDQPDVITVDVIALKLLTGEGAAEVKNQIALDYFAALPKR